MKEPENKDAKVLASDAAIVKALGGATRLSVLIAGDKSMALAIGMWRHRDTIPPRWRPKIKSLLETHTAHKVPADFLEPIAGPTEPVVDAHADDNPFGLGLVG